MALADNPRQAPEIHAVMFWEALAYPSHRFTQTFLIWLSGKLVRCRIDGSLASRPDSIASFLDGTEQMWSEIESPRQGVLGKMILREAA